MLPYLLKSSGTIEEYIELEKRSDAKYEYFDGFVFERSPRTLLHVELIMNVFCSLSNKLDRQNYEVLPSALRLKVPAAFPYRYPDISVICGEPIVEKILGQEMLVNPLVIVELYSPTTKGSESGERFIAYQSVASFQEYLLVAQERPHVTRYVRQADNQWLRSDFIGLDSAVELVSLGVTLPLSEIYQGVQFPPPTQPRS